MQKLAWTNKVLFIPGEMKELQDIKFGLVNEG